MPNYTNGLTPSGLGRLNRSIVAFGYCILGAQVNTRSSIIGNLGTAINTQSDFLVLVDDAIKTLSVLNGLANYQNALTQTKVRLNFVVARGTLLLPARMIINEDSVAGYNNKIRKTTDDMKLGVNNQVNQDTKKTGIRKMDGAGGSKVKPPNSHPSNKIHTNTLQAQGLAKTKPQTTPQATPQATPQTPDTVNQHHVNKTLVGISALALVGVVAWLR